MIRRFFHFTVFPIFDESLPMPWTCSAKNAVRCIAIDDIGTWYAVHPGAQRRTDRFDTEGVPRIPAERLHGFRLTVECMEPSAARFIVDAAGPRPVGGIDLCLIAEDPSTPDIRVLFTPELDARIQSPVDPEITFEDEIAERLRCAEETVR